MPFNITSPSNHCPISLECDGMVPSGCDGLDIKKIIRNLIMMIFKIIISNIKSRTKEQVISNREIKTLIHNLIDTERVDLVLEQIITLPQILIG